MKAWKNLPQLIPSVIVGIIVMIGLKVTTPIFDEIQWPEIPVFAQEKETEKETEEESESETDGNKIGEYEDGTYMGQGVGYAGYVQVQVTVSQHQISEVQICSHNDTPSFFQKAMAVIDKVISDQTWNVDTVSGATFSSRGILEGVQNALTGEASTSSVGADSSVSNPGRIKETAYKDKELKDGVYTGKAKGFGGQIKVQVTIKNGKITEIIVLDHSNETDSYYQRAVAIIARIIKKQSPNVDTISGATYSSNGIREAVKNALNKAAAGKPGSGETEIESEDETEQITENVTENTPEVLEGLPKDGAYSSSSICQVYGYKVTVTSTFSDGVLTDLSFSTDNQLRMNESFITLAWNTMKTRLLNKQTGEVDTVSGATYTSSAIRSAYIKTLNKAISKKGEEQETEEQETETEEEQTETETETEDITETEDQEESSITMERSIKGNTVTYIGYTDVDAQDAKNAYAKGMFEDYKIKVKLVFEDGIMKSFSILAYDISLDVSDGEYNDDLYYSEYAAAGMSSKIDTISGATCSSKGLIRFYNAAKKDYDKYLKQIKEEQTEKVSEIETETETELETETETETQETETQETELQETSVTEMTESKETEVTEIPETEPVENKETEVIEVPETEPAEVSETEGQEA